MLEPYVGQIIPFAGNFAPKGWAFCNGQILPINQNTALFSLLGTTYGGDGKTNFALPDFRDRTVIHPSNKYELGKKGGEPNKQLMANNLPVHTHPTTTTIKANFGRANTNNPVGAFPAGSDSVVLFANTSNGTMAADSVTGVTVSTEGGNQPLNNMQPYLAVNFIIALQGEFPPRS